MSGSMDAEKKGSPISEPEVLSIDRRVEDDAVDRVYDMKSELGQYGFVTPYMLMVALTIVLGSQ